MWQRIRQNLLLQFSILSFVVMAIISAVLLLVLTANVRSSVLAEAGEEARDTLALRVTNRLTPADMVNGMTGSRYDEFHRFVQDAVVSDRTARVKVWNPQGMVVYSTDRSQVGQTFPIKPELREALGGGLAGEISVPKAAENAQERLLGTLVEVYAPISFPGRASADGSLEIYQYYAPFAKFIYRQQQVTILVVAAGFAFLYLSLVYVVARGWLTIKLQTRRLEQKDQEVKAVAELGVQALNEKARLEESVGRQKERLARLSVAMTLAQGSPGPIELGRELLGLVQQEVGAQYARLTLIGDGGTQDQHLDRFNGIQQFQVSGAFDPLTETILKSGKTQYMPDLLASGNVNPTLVATGMRSSIGLPLTAEGRAIGVLCFHSTRPDAFNEDRLFLESFAGICAIPLQRARLLSGIEQAKEELEATFDAVPSAVVLIDENKHILRANRAFSQLVNKQLQTIPGTSLCKLVHGHDEFLHRCPFDDSMASTGQTKTFREPFIGNISVSVQMHPVASSPGATRRYIAFLSAKS